MAEAPSVDELAYGLVLNDPKEPTVHVAACSHDATVFHNVEFAAGCIRWTSRGHLDHTATASCADYNGLGVLTVQLCQ
jgi:hypothetical protein